MASCNATDVDYIMYHFQENCGEPPIDCYSSGRSCGQRAQGVYHSGGVPLRRCTAQEVYRSGDVPLRRCIAQEVYLSGGVPLRKCTGRRCTAQEVYRSGS
eukprot:9476504-Pyramimonas_sp.AAC.1